METPDRKHHISRLALRQGIHRTRERELAAGEHAEPDVPDPMGPPPTAVSVVRDRNRTGATGGHKAG